MTRDEAKEAAMVMLAYANGEQVQVQLADGSWVDFPINPNFDWNHVNYRIKPKPESKYRPFVTKEECWNEMLKHKPFGWVIETVTNYYKNIYTVLDYDIIFYGSTGFKTDFNLMVRDFRFIDGTPFGIKEE